MISARFGERLDFGDDGLYRGVTHFAQHSPEWLQWLAEFGTQAGLVLFALVFAVAAWRTRTGTPRAIALVWASVPATGLAYLTSEIAKSLFSEERPCRAVPGAVAIDGCPPPGDWAFPSNHSVIAAAAATSLIIAWRRCVVPAVLLALTVGMSRVFLGVHYPHDVLAGFLLGVALVLALRPLLLRLLLPLARRWAVRRGAPPPLDGAGVADEEDVTSRIPPVA